MLNTIDLFVGCGGLSEGFEQSRKYKMIGAVEWEPSPVKELRNHLKNRWGIQDSEERVLQFDIQRTEELFNGWKDKKFGESKGLDALVGNRQLDVIIGGPPCQAYSVAGRIRDEHGMREDYRNYLFESYLKVVQHYKPRVFVFENVPGILSAKPGDGSVRIIDLIQKAFADAGYAVLPDLSNAIIDMTEYGVPQNRKRIIILGVSKEHYGDKAEAMVEKFYSSYLPEYKIEKKATVRDAIGDLPKLRPLDEPISYLGRKLSHSVSDPLINGHISRFHNKELKVLLIQRGAAPYEGCYALPGGFVGSKETIGEAAERELKEETNCNCNFLEQFGTYSNPDRDPRRWVISNGYMALVNAGQEIIQAGDDASDAKWFDVSFQEEAGIWNLCLTHGDEKLHARLEETTSKWDVKKKFKTIESDDLAFDHELILADAIVQLRKWITETHIAFRLLPEQFTLRELQQIHETVLDTKLLVPAFRRKVADLVEDTGEMTGDAGHRPAKLYQEKR